MIQTFKRYFAIRSYVKRLSRELLRRFGRKPFYTVANVTQAVQRGGCSMAFIQYAHAIYCSEADFAGHYGTREVSRDYFKLRLVVADRYLFHRVDFDAQTICDKYGGSAPSSGGHYESGIGITGSGMGHY